jgi:N-acyl-D-aspartate/D-glutamate deacylase
MTIARTLENVEDMDVASLEAGIPWDFETFPEYLASIGRRGTILNFNAYVGHTALRLYVMGDAAYERAATDEEVASMCSVLRESMEAGAIGFATSFATTHRGVDGKPIPSRFAERSEFDALCDVLTELGRGVVHIAPGEQVSFGDLADLQKRIQVPITYAALLTFPGDGHLKIVEQHEKGIADGANVWPQVSPRPLTFQMTMEEPFTLNVAPLFGALIAEPRATRLERYRDVEWRARATEELKNAMLKPRWETFEVAESEAHPELVDRKISDIAAERGVPPLDAMLEIALDEDLGTRFRCIVANDDKDGVAMLLNQDHVVLGLSDAGAHVGQLCDAPQATDLLGNWVRDRNVMPIEKAIRKLSGEPADIFGIVGRGYLREGYRADIVVFDPDTVAPGPIRRVRDFPANGERLTADTPSGVTHVLVNGTPIRVDGESLIDSLETRPGRIIEIQ